MVVVVGWDGAPHDLDDLGRPRRAGRGDRHRPGDAGRGPTAGDRRRPRQRDAGPRRPVRQPTGARLVRPGARSLPARPAWSRPAADGELSAAGPPGGTIVLEEVDPASWHFIPPAPAFDRLKPLVGEAFRKAGGDPDAAATQLELSAAPASRSTPAPRSRHCPRATPTCGCRWSISPPCKGCCGRSWTPRSSSGSSSRPSGSSRTPAAGGSRSPSSSAGACVGA